MVTDGVFLRRLQNDPGLEEVDCVIFDEFHERCRDSGLALALLQEAPPRPSATADIEGWREATVQRSPGRSHPVETRHQAPRPDEPLHRQVLRALEDEYLPWTRGCDRPRVSAWPVGDQARQEHP